MCPVVFLSSSSRPRRHTVVARRSTYCCWRVGAGSGRYVWVRVPRGGGTGLGSVRAAATRGWRGRWEAAPAAGRGGEVGGQRRRCGGVLCSPPLRAGHGLSLAAAAAGAAGSSRGASGYLTAATASWQGLQEGRAASPLGVGGGEGGRLRRLGGEGLVGRQRRGGIGVRCPPPRAGRGLSLATVAGAGPSWGGCTLPPPGFGKGVVERQRRVGGGGEVGGQLRRGGVVLCPPLSVFHGQKFDSWCTETGRMDLLGEWDDPVKGPDEVTKGSKEKVRWKCGKEGCGHVWFAQVGNRTGGQGCPACAGKVPTATNNFKVHCEANGLQVLLREWVLTDTEPVNFLPQSKTEVPWMCEECGWQWETPIYSRTGNNPSGCPACAGSVATPTKNLKVWCGENGREELLEEWAHPDMRPQDFTPASHVKVPWKCVECWKTFVATIYNRTGSNATGCPTCMGSRDDGPGVLYRNVVYVQDHGNRVVLVLDGKAEFSPRMIKIGGIGASRKGADGCMIRAFINRTRDEGYDYLAASKDGLRGDPDTGVIATVILWPVADGNIRAENLVLAAFKAVAGRGLHSSTFQLNFNALYGIGGARRGRVARVKGLSGGLGCLGCFLLSDTAQVEQGSGRV